MNTSVRGESLDLEPQLRDGFQELVAIQKNGSMQYGRIVVDLPDASMAATLGYRRYRGADASDSAGQDFAILRVDQEFVVGVLADGVSQSFYGDLAADYVGRWLMPALWDRRRDPPAEAELESGLKLAEKDFAAQIENKNFDHLPELHRGALQATRKSGSQAVFAAFIWQFARRSGCLYQVGDAISLVCGSEGSRRMESNPRGRWSSAGKSELFLRKTDLRDITAILIKSDGADSLWGSEIGRQTIEPLLFEEMAYVGAENDDVSYVAACMISRADLRRETGRGLALPAPPTASRVAVYAQNSTAEPSNPPTLQQHDPAEPQRPTGHTGPPGPEPQLPRRKTPSPMQPLGDSFFVFAGGLIFGVLLGLAFPFLKTSILGGTKDATLASGSDKVLAPVNSVPLSPATPATPAVNDDPVHFFALQVEGKEWAVDSVEIEGKSAPVTKSTQPNATLVLVPQSPKDGTLTLHLVRKQSGKNPKTLAQPVSIQAGKYAYDISIMAGATPSSATGAEQQDPKQQAAKQGGHNATNHAGPHVGSKKPVTGGNNAAANGAAQNTPAGMNPTPKIDDNANQAPAPGPRDAPTADRTVKPDLPTQNPPPITDPATPDDGTDRPTTPPHHGEM